MLTSNISESLPAVLASGKALQATADKHGLKPIQIRILIALSMVCKGWPGEVTPGQFAAIGLLSRTFLRAHLRALNLTGFVERCRNAQGQQVLRITRKGQDLVRHFLTDLHRAVRSLALTS